MTADDLAKILGTGVVAAVLTVGGTWLREVLASRKLATYSALRAAVTLETFALGCSTALAGDTISRIMAGKKEVNAGKLVFPPFPAFPEDIDWKLLDAKLMAETLTLKNDVEISSAHSIEMTRQILDDDNAHLSTIKEMADSALRAIELAERLRHGLPSLPNIGWLKVQLADHRLAVATEHARRSKAQLEDLKRQQSNQANQS